MRRRFWERHDAAGVPPSAPQPPRLGAPENDEARPPIAARTDEVADEDARDVGETVAWLTAPSGGGGPVPVRLAEDGAAGVRDEGSLLRGDVATVERIVSLAADLFPWDEIEALAISLQQHGFRLRSAPLPSAGEGAARPPAARLDGEVTE